MSTLARELAARMRLSQIHLDSEFWKPGWKVTERAEWRAKVTKLAERVAWIMDGNYGASLDLRLPRDDTLMWFDYPRLLCAWGALWRVATIYGRVRPDLAPGPGARTWRPDLAPGCPEEFDREFVRFIWKEPSPNSGHAGRAWRASEPHRVPPSS